MRRSLFVLGILASTGSSAYAQEAAVRGEKIEVTGSHIRRIEAETALPVSIITREEIRRSGVNSIAEMIDRIPANAGGYNLSTGLGDGSTPGLSAASLRGLGPNSTLVLLNGRRLANFAFNGTARSTVNLDQIPLAAVERVEVLKDGASAIYGTDAIAGVINVILRRDYAGAEATAYGSSTQDGGGQTHRYTASAGFGSVERDRFNVLVTADYRKDAVLKASQRKFASTGIRPDLGVALTSAQVHPANFIFAGRAYNVMAVEGCSPENGAYQIVPATGAPAPRALTCRSDFTSVLDIYPPSERLGFFLRGTAALAPGHQAFAEYHRARNEVTFAASETPVNDFTLAGFFRYPESGIYYPRSFRTPTGETITPTGPLRIAWRSTAAGLRTSRVDTDEDRFVAGVQGDLSGWSYNGALHRSGSRAGEFFLDGFLRASTFSAAIATGLIDVFRPSIPTPEAAALIAASKIMGRTRDSDAAVTALDLKVSREILETPHGPVSLALGLDHRKDELEERPEEVLFSGDILAGGGALPPTTRASRKVSSLFAELAVPATRDLELQLAVRHDRFSDFGSTTNPKIAMRWTPSPRALLRASFGTGFRAPTLTDLFLPSTQGFRFEADPARCPNLVRVGEFVTDADCGEQLVRFGGNRAAQPERSRQWTLGVLLEPRPGLSAGLDYWSIHRRNSLEVLSYETIMRDLGPLDPVTAGGRIVRQARLADGRCPSDTEVATPPNVPCPIDYVLNLLENVGNHNVSGVDVSATSRWSPEGLGTITLRFEGTYYLAYRFQNERGGPYLDAAGRVSTIGALSRWKHYAQLAWRRGDWDAALVHGFVHAYADQAFPGVAPRRVASHETWDLQGTWRAWRGLSLTGGVRNLLDRDPPASRQGSTFQVGYDARYYEPRGRTYYLMLRYAL